MLRAKLVAGDPDFRRASVALLVDQVTLLTDGIHISGTRSALEHLLVSDKPPLVSPVPIFDREWCGREDSNFHVLSDTATSRLRVYQFRHDRTCLPPVGAGRPVGAGP